MVLAAHSPQLYRRVQVFRSDPRARAPTPPHSTPRLHPPTCASGGECHHQRSLLVRMFICGRNSLIFHKPLPRHPTPERTSGTAGGTLASQAQCLPACDGFARRLGPKLRWPSVSSVGAASPAHQSFGGLSRRKAPGQLRRAGVAANAVDSSAGPIGAAGDGGEGLGSDFWPLVPATKSEIRADTSRLSCTKVCASRLYKSYVAPWCAFAVCWI